MRVRNKEITLNTDGLFITAMFTGLVALSYGVGRIAYFLDMESTLATFGTMPGFVGTAIIGFLFISMAVLTVASAVILLSGLGSLLFNVEEIGDE